ncbi:MAG: hypothetical protein ACRDPY_37070 [Streptosporangiaceae bacterium]
MLAGLGSVVFFAAVSATINGQPSTLPFRGWIALLQPFHGALAEDQVELLVAPLVPGGPGQHPALSYTVVACGGQPFRGVLLMGGDARLAQIQGTPALGTGSADAHVSVEETSDLEILDQGTGHVINLGLVQAVHIDMNQPGQCISAYAPQQVPPPDFGGQAQVVTGLAAAPVQRQWNLGWWSGPRTAQVWPLVGAFPGVSDSGTFQGLYGLSGSWIRFTRQYFAVNVGNLEARALVDEVRPAPASSTGLDWESSQPLLPTAQVTNTDSLSAWQEWLIGASICLGIGGSLLASALFEWARPIRPTDHPVNDRHHSNARVEAVPAQRSNPAAGGWAVVAILALLAWLLRTGRRHRPGHSGH